VRTSANERHDKRYQRYRHQRNTNIHIASSCGPRPLFTQVPIFQISIPLGPGAIRGCWRMVIQIILSQFAWVRVKVFVFRRGIIILFARLLSPRLMVSAAAALLFLVLFRSVTTRTSFGCFVDSILVLCQTRHAIHRRSSGSSPQCQLA